MTLSMGIHLFDSLSASTKVNSTYFGAKTGNKSVLKICMKGLTPQNNYLSPLHVNIESAVKLQR